MKLRHCLVAAAAAVALPLSASAAGVDEKLPVYEKAQGVSGNLSSVGSDTPVSYTHLTLPTKA